MCKAVCIIVKLADSIMIHILLYPSVQAQEGYINPSN